MERTLIDTEVSSPKPLDTHMVTQTTTHAYCTTLQSLARNELKRTQNFILSFCLIVGFNADQGCLLFTRKNQHFRFENQMVHVILFGKFQKLWTAGWDNTYVLLFLVFPTDVDVISPFPSAIRSH